MFQHLFVLSSVQNCTITVFIEVYPFFFHKKNFHLFFFSFSFSSNHHIHTHTHQCTNIFSLSLSHLFEYSPLCEKSVESGSGEWRTSILCLCGIFFSVFFLSLHVHHWRCVRKYIFNTLFFSEKMTAVSIMGAEWEWQERDAKDDDGYIFISFSLMLLSFLVTSIYLSYFGLFHLFLCSTPLKPLIHHLISFPLLFVFSYGFIFSFSYSIWYVYFFFMFLLSTHTSLFSHHTLTFFTLFSWEIHFIYLS